MLRLEGFCSARLPCQPAAIQDLADQSSTAPPPQLDVELRLLWLWSDLTIKLDFPSLYNRALSAVELECHIRYSNPKSAMRKTSRGLGTASPRGGNAPSTPCSQIRWEWRLYLYLLSGLSSDSPASVAQHQSSANSIGQSAGNA